MITRSEAIECATKHLEEHPIPSEEYAWIVTEPTQSELGWVFEYSYRCKINLPPEEWEAFGGAPGFVVIDRENIRDLDWSEMGDKRG